MFVPDLLGPPIAVGHFLGRQAISPALYSPRQRYDPTEKVGHFLGATENGSGNLSTWPNGALIHSWGAAASTTQRKVSCGCPIWNAFS